MSTRDVNIQVFHETIDKMLAKMSDEEVEKLRYKFCYTFLIKQALEKANALDSYDKNTILKRIGIMSRTIYFECDDDFDIEFEKEKFSKGYWCEVRVTPKKGE